MTRFYSCLIALYLSAGFISAQSNESDIPLTIGVTDKLYSNELNEVRTLNIYLPEGFHPDSATKYPVIYLLDGSMDEDFLHLTGIVQFLSFPWINTVEPSIVVGIANVDRKRDFTYPSADSLDLAWIPTGGGSARFISFIEKELQPYIEAKYHTTGQKTVIGQSLGGLVAAEILVRHSELFTHYMIISPSLWWNHSTLLAEVPAFFKANPNLSKHVFLSIGNEGKQMNDCMNKMVSYFKKYAPKSVKWDYFYMPAETHATSLHRGAYKGFEFFGRKEVETKKK